MSAVLSEGERDKERQVSIYVGAKEVMREANFGIDYVSSKDSCLPLSHFTKQLFFFCQVASNITISK